MMYVQSFTLEGCFHFNLLEGESFPVLTLNLKFNTCMYNMILWNHHHFGRQNGPIFKLQKCDVDIWNVLDIYTENKVK